MISFLLKAIGLNKLILIGAIVLAVSSGWIGYQVNESLWLGVESRAIKEAENKRIKAEKAIAEIERKYLEETKKRKVVYRDKIKKVVQYVDRDKCTVTNDGLQLINEALRGQSQ